MSKITENSIKIVTELMCRVIVNAAETIMENNDPTSVAFRNAWNIRTQVVLIFED